MPGQGFKTLLSVVLGLPVIPAAILVFAEIWPATWFMDLQAEWFDGYYYLKLTIILMWMTIAMPLATVVGVAMAVKKGSAVTTTRRHSFLSSAQIASPISRVPTAF